MHFQILDDKEQCLGVYADGRIEKDYSNVPLTHTWGYSPSLYGQDIQYAQIYCNGMTLDEACPEDLKADWLRVSSKLRAFLRSFAAAKISLDEHCFYDLVPERFLLEFYEVKNQITQSVFRRFSKPANYNLLRDVTAMTHEVGLQRLNINREALRGDLASHQARAFWKKAPQIQPRVRYNAFGTKTGRLTTHKNSFPILTLNKNFRKVLTPQNDWFVEIDYNAAELRTLLALSGQAQPTEDIHDWNKENVYRGIPTREEAKKRIFAWLYNPSSNDYLSDRAYDRDGVLKKYYDGEKVTTVFDREIPADKHHALNYIVQSTSSDIFLERAVEVWKFLKDKKSSISLLIHDSLLLDISDDEKFVLPEILNIFSDTPFGKYLVGVKAGRNFGDMKELR